MNPLTASRPPLVQRLALAAASVLLLTSSFIALSSTTANAAPLRSSTGVAQRVHPADNWWACAPGNDDGATCNDTDPFDTGCGSSRQYVMSGSYAVPHTTTKWQMQLWYSSQCHTMWARLQSLAGSTSCFDCILSVNREGNNPLTLDIGGDGQTIYSGAWTNQVDASCGANVTGTASLAGFLTGSMGYSGTWHRGC